MDPSPQRVRTRGPARPRNLAAGCLAVVVILASCGLLGWFLRAAGPEAPETPVPAASAPARPAP